MKTFYYYKDFSISRSNYTIFLEYKNLGWLSSAAAENIWRTQLNCSNPKFIIDNIDEGLLTFLRLHGLPTKFQKMLEGFKETLKQIKEKIGE